MQRTLEIAEGGCQRIVEIRPDPDRSWGANVDWGQSTSLLPVITSAPKTIVNQLLMQQFLTVQLWFKC